MRMFPLSRGLGPLLGLLVAAGQCLPVEQLEERSTISLKLIQTLSKSEFASLDAFSARGVLAVRTGDVIQLWDPHTHTLKASLTINGKLLDCFFTADGNTFITSTRGKSSGLVTRLWNAQTGLLETTLSGLIIHGPTAAAGGVSTVVTLTDLNELNFWNTHTVELQKTVIPYKRSFSDSKISPDGRVVVRYGRKKGFLWEAGTGRLIAELVTPEKRGTIVPWYSDLKLEGAWFSPDSKILATKDSLGSVELWDTDTGRLRALLEGHRSTIYTAAFSPDGRLFATASRDGTAKLWDVVTGREHATLEAGNEIARRVVFNPEGTSLAVGYHTQARVWDVSSGRLQATLPQHSDVNKIVLFGTYLDGIEILVSPDGRLLLTIGNKTIQIRNAATGTFVTTLKGAHSPVAFAPDSKSLAATGAGDSVLVWAIQ
jgi:WD40 repeat protein